MANKKLTISISKNEDREAIEVLRNQLEKASLHSKRYSLAEAVVIAVNTYLNQTTV